MFRIKRFSVNFCFWQEALLRTDVSSPVHLANPGHPACVFYILGCAVANRAYGVWDVVKLDTVSNMRFVLSNVRLATEMIVYQIRNSLSNIVKYFFS